MSDEEVTGSLPLADLAPASGRIEGCQSANHTKCYGELWHCARCGKVVCYAEGSDNGVELCDDCWALKYPM
jgi:hypothetical protein